MRKKEKRVGPFFVSDEVRQKLDDIMKRIDYDTQTQLFQTFIKCLYDEEDGEKLLGMLQKYK